MVCEGNLRLAARNGEREKEKIRTLRERRREGCGTRKTFSRSEHECGRKKRMEHPGTTKSRKNEKQKKRKADPSP